MGFLHGMSAIFRALWNERHITIPAILIIVLFVVLFRYVKWGIAHGNFCAQLRYFCKKNHMKYKSSFFKTILKRRSLLGYTIRISNESQTYSIQIFPYECAKKTVHFFNDFNNVLLYKVTVMVKPEIGKGESTGFEFLNRIEHYYHKKKMPQLSSEESIYLVFTSLPNQLYVTVNGTRELVGSGYKTQKIIIYEANDFMNYLKRNILGDK